jgi:hypothetical protein
MGGIRMARLSWTTLFVLGGLALASPAQAQTANTAYAVGYASPYNSPNSVTLAPIQVLASVGGRCGYAAGNAPNGSVNAPSFDTLGFDQSFNFVLDCTGAFRVGVVSLNGGLLTGGAVPTGYGVKAPYDVQLNLRNDANTVTASSACQAAELFAANNATTCSATYLGGGTNFSGPASTSKGLRVNAPATALTTNQTIRVKANAYAGPDILTAGTYTDTLTVTVSVAP